MTAGEWLASRMGRLRPRRTEEEATPESTARPSRQMQRMLTQLQSVVDSRVSEVEGARRARTVMDWYRSATAEQRRELWLLMSERFAPDARKVAAARDQYDSAAGSGEEGAAEIRLRKALVSPRTRLLQRISVCPDGVRFLVDLRAELLPHLKGERRLLALDAELEGLFSTWFDVAFLELRRMSWDSPASLIEKLIKYEAVHDIRSWADLKNRLDSDRRCYGFFHPRLPDEPLIFVEVALLDRMADSITPLLDEAAAAADLQRATTAVFYSISNTQTGLRGVSFGDALIKRVVETLKAEFPKLKTFVTLSPVPGFRAWLGRNAAAVLSGLGTRQKVELAKAMQVPDFNVDQFLQQAEGAQGLGPKAPLSRLLLQCAAQYLAGELHEGKPLDAVARFHLGNGARIERLNWNADPSSKGWKQSYGIMVNYLYDLRRLDRHRAMLAEGKIPVSGDIENLKL